MLAELKFYYDYKPYSSIQDYRRNRILSNRCHKMRMLTSRLIHSSMLTHGEFKVIFLHRSEKDLFSDVYFCISSSYGFLLMKDLKKLSQYPKIERIPPPPLNPKFGSQNSALL